MVMSLIVCCFFFLLMCCFGNCLESETGHAETGGVCVFNTCLKSVLELIFRTFLDISTDSVSPFAVHPCRK